MFAGYLTLLSGHDHEEAGSRGEAHNPSVEFKKNVIYLKGLLKITSLISVYKNNIINVYLPFQFIMTCAYIFAFFFRSQ